MPSTLIVRTMFFPAGPVVTRSRLAHVACPVERAPFRHTDVQALTRRVVAGTERRIGPSRLSATAMHPNGGDATGVVNVDGTGLTQVTHTGGSQGPDWGTHPLTP